MRQLLIAIVLCAAAWAAGHAGEPAHASPEATAAMVDNVLNPFWNSTAMNGESLFFGERKAGDPLEARLLFPPEKVVSVKSATGEKTFEEGKDYTLDKASGVFRLPPGSGIPWKTFDAMHPPSKSGDNKRGTIFSEGSFFHKIQVEVVYTHKEGAWTGCVPKFAGASLPNTMKKLRAKEPVKLCISGDSISQGYNASGFTKAPPYMPPYGELVALGLEKTWGSKVTCRNYAVAGWTAGRGVADVARVAAEKPDLVIIAYGMNEGGPGGGTYANNVKAIMGKVKEASPDAEFILVSPMLQHKSRRASFLGMRDALAGLCGNGAVLADVTSVWDALLDRKDVYDLTGNGVNHPNDFGHRVYAQVILALMVEPKKPPEAK